MDENSYFKVIDKEYIIENKLFDTKNINHYKNNLEYYELLKPLFLKSCELDTYYNYGLDLYICLYNNLCLYGGDYLDFKRKECGDCIDIYNLTSNENHIGQKIMFEDLLKISYEIYDTIDYYIMGLPIGVYLCEYMFEEERKKNFIHAISRLDSFFVFNDIKACEYYINRWNKSYSIAEIIPVNIENYFISDIKHIDNIENHITSDEYRNIANKYWKKEFTDEPILEVFFHGTFKMKRIDL